MKIGKSSKRRVKQALLRSGALALAARTTAPKVIVLRYHSVQEDLERLANVIGRSIIHSRADFEQQMEFLARRFESVTVDDILCFLAGEKAFPRRGVAVTFDDGYADNVEVAAPILQRFGIRASFYLTVDSIGTRKVPWFCRLRHAFATTRKKEWQDSEEGVVHRLETPEQQRAAFLTVSRRCACRTADQQDETLCKLERELEVEALTARENPMMSPEQARGLLREGHIVGSHTLSHPNVAQIANATARKEILTSRQRLEKELCAPVEHFAYPNPIIQPHWNEQTVALTKEAGYRTGVTSTTGAVCRGDNPLSLRRISAPLDVEEFAWQVEISMVRG